MKTGKACIAVILAVLCSFPAFCLDLETDFRREISLYHIRPDQARSLKRDQYGTAVSEEQLEDAVGLFYDCLYPLGPVFLKRFQIKTVIFKDTVYDPDGKSHQYRLVGSDLYLDADLDDKQLYAAMFFLQLRVMPRIYLNHWNKLNPDGFFFENTRGSLTAHAQQKLDAILAEWDNYFVSRTGMYSTEMDMALTFAYMVMNGPDATAFVRETRPTVQKKFDLMYEILEVVKAVEPGCMQTLMTEDLSTLKTYSPRALAVRLFFELTDQWNALEPVEEIDERFEMIAEMRQKRINGPVEVAGRKIVPLILALETKDMKLFRALMQYNADPSVSNAKKVSALMLAIANNDPEQVRLLLEAGASVTPEATRAGTASGVNAEIVKLMKSYLPGVRQTDVPEKSTEKKKADKTATTEGMDPRESENRGTALYKRLREEKIDHIGLKETELAEVVRLLQARSRALASGGEGIRISIPQKYARTPVTVVGDKLSMYEVLQIVGRSAGLELLLEDPDKVVLSGSNSKQTDAGKKNGSAKKKP